MRIALTLLFAAVINCSDSLQAQAPRSGETDNNETHSLMFFLFLDNDGGISNIGEVPVIQCNSTITPSIVIENYGNNVLTSATLQYFLDGGIPSNYYWTGSLDPLFKDTILLPSISVSPGVHTFNVMVTQANGQVDINGGNNSSISFSIIGAGEQVPYAEEFINTNGLPEGYFVDNPDEGITWQLFTNFIYQPNNNAVRMPFYINDASGDADDLYMKNIDLSSSIAPQLTFKLAYAYYSDYYWDELQVLISTDCGSYWDIIYDKAKDDLATAPFTDVHFTPTAAEWRTETVDLSDYSGTSDAVVKFRAINGHGNHLYLDDIRIDENTGISDVNESGQLQLFPNPAGEFVTISIPHLISGYYSLEVINTLGQSIFNTQVAPQNQFTFPVSQFADGTYIIALSSENNFYTASLLVAKK